MSDNRRINQQDCTSFPRKWESAVTDMLALDYYADFALSKINSNINTAKPSTIIKINQLDTNAILSGQKIIEWGVNPSIQD